MYTILHHQAGWSQEEKDRILLTLKRPVVGNEAFPEYLIVMGNHPSLLVTHAIEDAHPFEHRTAETAEELPPPFNHIV